MRPHHQLPLDNAACDQAWSICQGGAAIGSRRQSDPKPRNAQEPIFFQINGTPRSCPAEKSNKKNKSKRNIKGKYV